MKREDLINAIGQIDGKTVKSTEKKLKSEKKGGRALLINTVTALVLLAILVPIIKLAVTRGRNSGSEGGKEQTQDSGREAHEAVTDVLLVNDLVSFDEMKSAFYNVMNDTVEIGKFRFYTLKTESDFEELKEKYGDLIQDPPFYYDGFFNDCDMVAVIFGENVVMNRRDVSAEISPDGGVFIDAQAPEVNDFDEALSTSCILLDTGRKTGKYYLAKVGFGDYFGGYSIKIEGIEYTLGDKDYVIYSMPSQHGKIEVLGLSELRFRTNSGTIDAVDAFRCGAVTVDILKDYLDSTGCSVMFHGSGIQHETYYFDEITVDLISGGQFAVKFIAPEYEHWTEEPEDETTKTPVSATEPVVTDGPNALAEESTVIHHDTTSEIFKRIEHSGTVRPELEKVISGDLFFGAKAFKDRLLVSHCISEDKDNRRAEYRVEMMDIYGNIIASYTVETDDAYHVMTLTVTDDGGFLFVLGFLDYEYDYQNYKWASDNGFASRVIKCDRNGNLQFDVSINNIEGEGLRVCVEKNGFFYLFGNHRMSSWHDYGETDIYVLVLDSNGNVISQKYFGGSDFDLLYDAEERDDIFLLSVYSQSDDRDFAGSDYHNDGLHGMPPYYILKLNEELEIIEITETEWADVNSCWNRIGEREGRYVYTQDEMFRDYEAGRPSAYVEYGDYYLIVSNHPFGLRPVPASVNSVHYYVETVYSAYDYSGRLIFRTAVDNDSLFY